MAKLKSLGARFFGGLAIVIRGGLAFATSFGCSLGFRLVSGLLEELLVLPAHAGLEGFGLLALHIDF